MSEQAMSAEEAEAALAEMEREVRYSRFHRLVRNDLRVRVQPDYAIELAVLMYGAWTILTRAEALAWLRGEGVTCRCCQGTGKVQR